MREPSVVAEVSGQSKRLRIALVGLAAPFRGGIAHHTTALCIALRERHDVYFCAWRRQYPRPFFPGTRQTEEQPPQPGTERDAVLRPLAPLSWITSVRRILAHRPDVVLFVWWHPFFAPALGTIARIVRSRGPRVCFLCHNVHPHEGGRFDAALTRWALASADALIVQSGAAARELEASRRRTSTVLVCPHPVYDILVPTQIPSRAEARARLGIAESTENEQGAPRCVILFFGFVRPYKGLGVLLEAMRRLPDGFELIVAGEFYEPRERYEAALEVLRQRGRLTLLDRYVPGDQVADCFAAADAVVLPYSSGSQSGVLQLAYAFDKPVVATDVGGHRDVIVDGETGYLVTPDDPEALARSLRQVARLDPGVAAAAVRRQARQLSWDRLVATVETAADGATETPR